jgi:hypothetical protein
VSDPGVYDAFEVQREEALRFAINEAGEGRTKYIIWELSDTRRPAPPWFRLWLADALDPNGKSEFAARLTTRTVRRRGRPKATATPLPGPETWELVWPLVAIMVRWLRALDKPLNPEIGPMLARWLDPEGQTFVRATIRRRRPGAPSRPTRRMVEAAYHVVVNIQPDSNLKRLLAEAINLYSKEKPAISRSKLYAYVKARWPDLFPKARAARRASRCKKIE